MAEILGEWLSAVGVLALTFLAVGVTRAILKRVPAPVFLREFIPSLGNLIFLFGAKAFIEVAPLSAGAQKWMGGAVYVLTVVLLLSLLRRAAMLALEWSVSRARHSEVLQHGFVPLIRNVVTLFVVFTGTIMVLQHFGYDVLSLLTALGVGSLALGLAAKDTLSNMISGFTLIIDRNLRPGDRVNLGGSIGDVEEIGLRSTRVRVDGNILIVPNAELANTKILNLTLGNRELTASTVIKVPMTVSFPRVREISFEVMSQVERLKRFEKRRVDLLSLADGHQQIGLTVMLSEREDTKAVISELNEKLLSRLQQDGIALVTPTPPPAN